MYEAMVALTVAFGAAMRLVWTTVALSWAVGLRTPYAIMLAMSAGLMQGMGAIFSAGWLFIRTIFAVGYAALIGTYRIMWIALTGITTIFSILLPSIMAGMWATLKLLFAGGGKAILFPLHSLRR